MTSPTRKRWTLYAGTLLALALTVPWVFVSPSGEGWLGLPGWAIYTVVATVLYGGLIAWSLGWGWNLSAGDEPESPEPPRPEDHRR